MPKWAIWIWPMSPADARPAHQRRNSPLGVIVPSPAVAPERQLQVAHRDVVDRMAGERARATGIAGPDGGSVGGVWHGDDDVVNGRGRAPVGVRRAPSTLVRAPFHAAPLPP